MLRTVWLGLGCLICIGGLFALKISLVMSTKLEPAADDPTIVASINLNASPKADKLDASYVDNAPDKITVKPIAIVPPKADASPSEKVNLTERTTKIISRHWHEGYAKLNSRSAHKPGAASRRKRVIER
jgi:hypothetical protein